MEKESTVIYRNKNHSEETEWVITRRDFLKYSSILFAGYSIESLMATDHSRPSMIALRFGIVTDTHYAKTEAKNNRYYSESVKKMTECVQLMNDRKVDFLVELGDFKDQDNIPAEKNTLGYLKTIEEVFRKFKGNRYHVLGNHDVDSISKNQFCSATKNSNISQDLTYYSFDNKWVHFIVLDANFRSDNTHYNSGNFDWKDSNIPSKELQWLEKELTFTSRPVIVFVHQNLDGTDDYCVKNAQEVRHILQSSRKVLAVFQGHKHSGDYHNIEGIHYYTLKAMVEGSGDKNNAFAIVEVSENHSLTVTGYRRALSMELENF